jgi:hypothetical protein
VPSDDCRLEVRAKHYEDSFSKIESLTKQRGWLFVASLVGTATLLLPVFSDQSLGVLLGEVVASKLGITTKLDTGYVVASARIGLLWILVRYFQTSIWIDRQYPYLHALELELNKEVGGVAFSREGRTYLEGAPKFNRWSHFLYFWLFPIAFVFSMALMIIAEWRGPRSGQLLLWIDTTTCLLMIVSTVLYVLQIHFKK